MIDERLKSELNQLGQWLRQVETIDKQGYRGGKAGVTDNAYQLYHRLKKVGYARP
ncbi:hypothetical protein [Spartinivicinus poritis]|uniref:Uncharacterized protein n=1 Tax=Spartinivicinus poritis TaxID=2994640 RepID=A0ABT5UGF5_9GAMM|nr:hypothetical protein [Spartinivicinus sp. A2-2]MDE1465468.1 hypothetical protein [Spartinivicinus sp. A2-2]